MTNADQDALKEYADAGVDLPELNEETKGEAPAEEPAKPEETPADPDDQAQEPVSKDEAPLQEEPKEPRKRSIYDDLKDKKAEVKSERQLREQAEARVAELEGLLRTQSEAITPEEKRDAQDELDAFIATHKEWDKSALQDLIDIARKGVRPELPPDLASRLEAFEAWQAKNSSVMEKQAFEEEFQAVVPTLKELFPSASEEEMTAIKAEVDKLSHTEAFHDKDLDYVVFKNKAALEPLVSPRKPGIERKGRREAEGVEFTFDPNADLSKMTPAELEKWEEEYRKLGKAEGLSRDSAGKPILI